MRRRRTTTRRSRRRNPDTRSAAIERIRRAALAVSDICDSAHSVIDSAGNPWSLMKVRRSLYAAQRAAKQAYRIAHAQVR